MNEAPDDVSVMARLRDGDADAWDSLYRTYRERVWRYVARATGADVELVADLVQETFLHAARSAKTYDAERGGARGWLLGIASRRIAGHWRKVYRVRIRSYGDLAPTADDERSPEDGIANGVLESQRALSEPERSLSQKQRAEALRIALASLPDDYAALLTGKYFDDATLEDLAAERGETAVAISSRLARARTALRQALRRVSPHEFSSVTSALPSADDGRTDDPSTRPG